MTLIPHEQIEIYKSFEEVDDRSVFGPYNDVVGISFNPHLDYYHVEHWKRDDVSQPPIRAASQNMYYFELTEYIERSFGSVDRDRIILRHLDIPITPLICWLEHWYGLEQVFASVDLQGKSNVETYGFHDELLSIMGAAGVLTLSEPPVPILPLRHLASGEVIDIQPS